MTTDEGQHVFISYVREDKDQVDRLCNMLTAAQIPFWRDMQDLGPGDWWKLKIREAIRNDALVFLACFSDNSRGRQKNNMNEEINLAVEELRKMPPGHTWMIPVRFDEGVVPEWELGAGRSLNDVNRVDLFGESYTNNAVSLISAIHRIMGESPKPATTRALVDEARLDERPELLRKLTKEMLMDSSRRIDLDDLIVQETRSIIKFLTNDERYSKSLLNGTNEENHATLVRLANENWEVVRPFCYSLAVAARWGEPDSIAPWISGIKSIVTTATKHQDGYKNLSNLRHIAALAVISVAALTCSAHSKWANFRALLAEPNVPDKYRDGETMGILEATAYWKPFESSESTANIFSKAETTDGELSKLIDIYVRQTSGNLYTPVADWLHAVLAPVFDDQFTDREEYDREYLKAEVMLGVTSQDVVLQNARKLGHDTTYARSHWFGRSTWASRYARQSPVTLLEADIKIEGASWPPIRGGLFGSNELRALQAVKAYNEDFVEISKNRL
ncbi:toll/interleukin-1 receptor domain-containing protein [Paeniglutamicibacter sp.]|uniref:toll/interleukin-1 receptor domain-containing protein n=1 Tax=Paeniglutamicibacter sp. TaxID=1934391 RepID=UPI003989C4A4